MKTFQQVLGYTIPAGVQYTIQNGWSESVEPSADLEIDFDINAFTHIFACGSTFKGKGVACSTFGCYMAENHKLSFIDFNDQWYYENGYYGWPQDNPNMKKRLEEDFFLKPHGYDFEYYFPNGTQMQYPTFAKPYTISYKDVTAMDLNIFDKEAGKNLVLAAKLDKCNDIMEFMKVIHGFSDEGYQFFKYLVETGILTEETSIDFDNLSNYKQIHSFTTANITENQHKQALSNIVLRLIQASRVNKDCHPALLYIREAPSLDQTFLRYFTTTVRHANLCIMLDAQRRTKLIDPTAGQQFSSQILLQMGMKEGRDVFEDFGIPEVLNRDNRRVNLLSGLSNADRGIALMNLVGSEPVFPFAVSPPVCAYRTKSIENRYPSNYINVCKEHGEEIVNGEET